MHADRPAAVAWTGDRPKSRGLDVEGVDKETFDLSVKNPNGREEVTHRNWEVIMDKIAALDAESAEVLQTIGGRNEVVQNLLGRRSGVNSFSAYNGVAGR